MKSTNQKFDYFSRVLWTISLLILSIIFAQTNFAAGAIDPTFNASVTEGSGRVTRTLTQPDGKIITIGGFHRANGARFSCIARFNADGTLDTTFNGTGSGANAAIYAVALQTDGKIVIGGNFTAFNGQAINHLARLNANGSLDSSFNPTVNFVTRDIIYDIVIQPDGKILVSNADLSGLNQTLPNRILRFNSDGSTDATFQNNTYDANIYSIVLLASGKILIGGDFSTIGGVVKRYLARLNADGSLDNTFSHSEAGIVNKVLLQPDGRILLAGSFAQLGIVIRLNADGSQTAAASRPAVPLTEVFTAFDIGLQPDGKVVAIYGHGTAGEVTEYSVIRFNSDLTRDATFPSTMPDRFPIRNINMTANGKFIISGDFVALNDQPRLYVVQMSSEGTVDSAFQPAISSISRVNVIKRQPDGKILIGGIFEYVNGIRRTNIARLNTDGSVDNSFNVPPEVFAYSILNFVYDIELQSDGKIVVGRQRLGGNSILLANPLLFSDGSIIRLNADGSLDSGFATITTHMILSLAIAADDKVFIGGWYENTQTPPFGSGAFRKLNSNGDLDMTFMPPAQPSIGSVREIVIQPDGEILIGGAFSNTGGFPNVGTARFNADGGFDSSYNASIPNVSALGLANDGKIYLGGSFNINGGNPNPNFTRLNENGSVDSSFSANANATVRDILVQPNGKIIIGGDFTTYNGNSANRVARANSDGSTDTSFNTGAGASGNVYALERQPDGKILVGGQFLDFNGTEKLSLVRLQNSNALAPFDFDGDSRTDISIFRPSNGEWWYQRSSDNQVRAAQFGSSSDKIVPADYTGDGKTDIAVWRPATGEWYILRSEDGSYFAFPFGQSGDIPAPGDFDGDGKTDAAVFRPSNATWHIFLSTGGTRFVQFGTAGDLPTVGDYDGDQVADIAIFRPSSGGWWLNRSSSGIIAVTFGSASDKPAQGDYTGDGKTDIAFWRPTTGEWFVLRSENGSYFSAPFGATGDFPTVGDYDGDGKFDFAVFRPSIATWYVNRTTSGLLIQQFGLSTDTPVPSAFVP